MAAEPSLASRFKRGLRDFVVSLVQKHGTLLHDAETGEPLGRVLLLPWKGKIHVIGLEAEFSVRARFINQRRLTYWKQEIGFIASPVPDYPHEPTVKR